ncbi:MAG: uroporphyrinogen-III synthase [Fidelibacterota bacterium]
MKKINLDFDHFQNRIVVVGAETANEIKSIFNRDSDYPDTQNSIGLSSILQKFKNKRAVLITGARTRPELPNWLSRNKWDVLSLVVYQTRIFKNRGLNSKFRNDRNDAVIFSSPSTVMGFLQSTNYSDLSSIQSRLLSIGKTTSKTVIEHNGNVYYEAITPSGELLISEALKMLNDTPINV